jgi:predicted nucleic acid-binding protein
VTDPGSAAVVVDTMVVSSILNAARESEPSATYRALIAGRRVVVSFATVTELRYGALKAGWGDLRRRGLERDLARLVIVQPDDELMAVCARLRAQCEAAGHGLGQKVHEADRWIAATAIRLDLDLVSADRIFDGVPGLRVVVPPA